MRGRMTLSTLLESQRGYDGRWLLENPIQDDTFFSFGEAVAAESLDHTPRAARPSLARRSPRLTGE